MLSASRRIWHRGLVVKNTNRLNVNSIYQWQCARVGGTNQDANNNRYEGPRTKVDANCGSSAKATSKDRMNRSCKTGNVYNIGTGNIHIQNRDTEDSEMDKVVHDKDELEASVNLEVLEEERGMLAKVKQTAQRGYARLFEPKSQEKDINMVRRATNRLADYISFYGKPNKKILVIGPTGSGKTTTLNSMMNYLYDAKFKDNFRYKLIFETSKDGGQTQSQTDDVAAYFIAPPNRQFTYTIIDTPGYCDTGGIAFDAKITEKIKHFLENEVDSLTAICFVVQSPQMRLTHTQRYIFDQMLNIFGNDIGDNIIPLFTFCDAKKPNALSAIKHAKIPCKTYFKLNNSAFFLNTELTGENTIENDDNEDNDENTEMDEQFYQMGITAFGRLFAQIDRTADISLKLTREVLQEREKLFVLAENLRKNIDLGMSQWDELQQTQEQVRQNKQMVEENKNFTFEYEKTMFKTAPLAPGSHTTTCMVCQRTCHEVCSIADDNNKKYCAAMDGDGNCKACPDKCSWTSHKNTPHKYIPYTEMVTGESEVLKKKYVDAKSRKSHFEQIMNGLQEDIECTRTKVKQSINQARQCANRINEIALNAKAYQESDYFDLLIQSAQEEKQHGWQAHVQHLQSLKAGHEFLGQVIESKKDTLDEFFNQP